MLQVFHHFLPVSDLVDLAELTVEEGFRSYSSFPVTPATSWSIFRS
jgi:hypothetical protein